MFVLCLLASAKITQAQHIPDKAYRGGGFMLEFGAFTSADARIPFAGFSLTPVGGYTLNKHLFLGGGASFCFNTTNDFFQHLHPYIRQRKVFAAEVKDYAIHFVGYRFRSGIYIRSVRDKRALYLAWRFMDLWNSRRFLSSA